MPERETTGWRWVKRPLGQGESLATPRAPLIEFEVPFIGVLCSAALARTWEWGRDGNVLWCAWLPLPDPGFGGGCLIAGPLSLFVGWKRANGC